MYEEKATFNVLKGTIPEFYSDVTFALIVDGKEQKDIPSQEEGNYAVEVKCDKGKGIWKQELWGLELTEIKEKKVRCNINFTTLTSNKEIDFDYTGKEETISLPKGNYKLEVWGAQGGVTYEEIKNKGGLGGYSAGTYNIKENEILYINVGGQGESGTEKGTSEGPKIYKGGYNGGGDAQAGAQHTVSGGGGATHIALVSGLLSTLKSNEESILIVAGGGGGNGVSYGSFGTTLGGCGGGIDGSSGDNPNPDGNFIGTGATQTSGGADAASERGRGTFGQGGFGVLLTDKGCNVQLGCGGSGGGGGFYGGGGSSRNHAGGGGGSGYIGNNLLTDKAMYCYNCETSEEPDTKTNTTTEVSTEAKSNTPKQGNGYAKITYIGQ